MHSKLEEFWAKSGPGFVELIAVGGVHPQTYGYIKGESDHPYGRSGLEQNEFFAHLELSAYVNGMLVILGKEEAEELGLRMKAEIDRVIQKNKDERKVVKLEQETTQRTQAGESAPQG